MSLLEKLTEMQGNYGPSKVMDWAMAAFTPNLPWARSGTRHLVSLSGAGTSLPLPKIAMTAALYRMKYFKELEQLPGLATGRSYASCVVSVGSKIRQDMDSEEFHLHFGQGSSRPGRL